MTTSDLWKIYYEHWAKDANLAKKIRHKRQCAQRIHDTMDLLFEDVMHVMSSQATVEEKVDVFTELVFAEPYTYLDDLEDLSDILLHGRRINNNVGNRNFSHLMSVLDQDIVMQILWAFDLWDVALSEMKGDEYITTEETELLQAIRSADSIVCLF